jgi:hypothetical protein
MQIPIMNGIFTDAGADFRTSYPLNLIPVPKDTGLSKGYLRTAEGMIEFANSIYSDSYDRGAINWDGICYRVIGDWLTRVNADQTIDYLGQVGNDGRRVVMVNGFDRLAIAAAGKLYYWSQSLGVVQVTDLDLGLVLDVIWIAGYFMTTDGENLVVTELNDPMQVNPLKYGSSEASPDPINSLLFIRNEAVAINRFSTEFFQNVGGSNFPFQRTEGAMIPKGSVGTHASCYFMESFAFVGSGSSQEAISVYLGAPGQATKIATREIETLLQSYTPQQLADIVVEERSDKMHAFLYIHLPDRTAVFDATASAETGERVWFYLSSGPEAVLPYRARNFVLAYGKWLFGDLQSRKIGYLSSEDAREFGEMIPWQFDTLMVYNEGNGALIHDLELVRLPGRLAQSYISPDPGRSASIFMSWSNDGLTYSNPRSSALSRPGQTLMRTCWRQLGRMEHFRAFRFRGMSNPAPDAIARLEARIEPLSS